MANTKQAGVRRLKMAERAQQAMDIHFPGIAPAWIWRRKTNDGYTTSPRTLPIVMQAVDAMSKGQPAGHTLLCLWARAPDHPLVTIENPATFAVEAGFSGERAVDTWRKRMKRLKELNLILTKPGATGEFHYVLLLNPNIAMESMRRNGKVQDGLYARFKDRVIEVGAYGDIEAFDALCATQQAAEKAKADAAAKATAAASPVAPSAAAPAGAAA